MMEKTIKKDIWEMISSVSYSTHIAGNAGRADQKFFEHLQEGIADNDLDKIYEFIDAYERGKSIKPDELVCRLFQKAYREDSARLCQLLAEKNNIVDYWIFLSTCCETDMLVDFAKMDVAYPCFYYECARILLKRTSGIDEKCKEAIIAAVKRIADRDLALWERWVQRKEHNTNWQQLLFSVLSKVSREALKRFAQTINLDMMLQNHKEDIVAWEFERLSDTSKKYILENISKDILENWNLLFEKKKKKHENLREIWFSGYFSLILNSLQYDLKNKEEWKLSFLNYEKILEKALHKEQTISNYIEQANSLKKQNNFEDSVEIWNKLHDAIPNNDYVTQQLAFAIYKAKKPNETIALQKALEVIMTLAPNTSLDLETLGITGAIYKRLYKVNNNFDYLEEAIKMYQRGYTIRNDYYTGENYANCLLFKTKKEGISAEETIYLQFSSKKIYSEIIDLLLTEIKKSEIDYWMYATLSTSYYVIGDNENHKKYEKLFLTHLSANWEKETYFENLDLIKSCLPSE